MRMRRLCALLVLVAVLGALLPPTALATQSPEGPRYPGWRPEVCYSGTWADSGVPVHVCVYPSNSPLRYVVGLDDGSSALVGPLLIMAWRGGQTDYTRLGRALLAPGSGVTVPPARGLGESVQLLRVFDSFTGVIRRSTGGVYRVEWSLGAYSGTCDSADQWVGQTITLLGSEHVVGGIGLPSRLLLPDGSICELTNGVRLDR